MKETELYKGHYLTYSSRAELISRREEEKTGILDTRLSFVLRNAYCFTRVMFVRFGMSTD